MTYERFEDLPVWQKAAELYEATEDLLIDYLSAVASLSPSEGERVRVRGWAEVLNEEFVNGGTMVPPHPGPLPLCGGEGEPLRTTKTLLAGLSLIPGIHQYIACGSAGEVRSMLTLKLRRALGACLKIRPVRAPGLHRLAISAVSCRPRALTRRGARVFKQALKRAWPADLKSQISNLKSMAESCSRQIRGWADSLQNSEIKGQRHLTDKSRREFEQKKRAAAFNVTLLRHLPEWHPKRKEAEEKGWI